MLDVSNHESDEGACLWRPDGLRAVHLLPANQVDEGIGGVGRVRTQRDPQGPSVLFRVCRVAHESPIDLARWREGSRAQNRQLTECMPVWRFEVGDAWWEKAKKAAVVAVARKLGILMYRLWVTGEVYEPLRNTYGQQEPKKAA